MRAILQFVGFASSTLLSCLLVGTLLTSSVRADPVPYLPSDGCVDCYGCSATQPCTYSGAGVNCNRHLTCSCVPNNGNPLCHEEIL